MISMLVIWLQCLQYSCNDCNIVACDMISMFLFMIVMLVIMVAAHHAFNIMEARVGATLFSKNIH